MLSKLKSGNVGLALPHIHCNLKYTGRGRGILGEPGANSGGEGKSKRAGK